MSWIRLPIQVIRVDIEPSFWNVILHSSDKQLASIKNKIRWERERSWPDRHLLNTLTLDVTASSFRLLHNEGPKWLIENIDLWRLYATKVMIIFIIFKPTPPLTIVVIDENDDDSGWPLKKIVSTWMRCISKMQSSTQQSRAGNH